MSEFEELSEALKYHIVSSLGWGSLRPLQAASIRPILEGRDVLLSAPTAGGKTEAAIFPLLSRMSEESWQPISLFYLCPLKALLNNLHFRLGSYAAFVGRTVGLWHGDIGDGERRRILSDRPDILLTTPESLEAMLVSRRVDNIDAFAQIQAVIVDEIHAFAGDDRGWHLWSLLNRIEQIARRPIQRVGLTATVGNKEELLAWFTGGGERVLRMGVVGGGLQGQDEMGKSRERPLPLVVAPEIEARQAPQVQIDYVGSLENAAFILSRLYVGEKRLVFVDSRRAAEELAQLLRGRGLEVYVSHSSLGLDERRQSEAAFRDGSNCLIIATSTLELGIDVGDLDRVIQIDAPATVASFLQRLGRTGRREGTVSNCLFLCTSSASLLQASALVELWQSGYVEPVRPPALPFHVLAEQVLTVLLQRGGLAFSELSEALSRFVVASGLEMADFQELVQFLLQKNFVSQTDNLLWIGPQAEAHWGKKNFMELSAVFYAPPLYKVCHGAIEVGEVHQATFLRSRESDCRDTDDYRLGTLVLGGRGWRVLEIDHKRKLVQVEPSAECGRSLWLSSGLRILSLDLCQSMRKLLVESEDMDCWSKRAKAEMAELRAEFSWLTSCSPKDKGGRDEAAPFILLRQSSRLELWTFQGLYFNLALAQALSGLCGAGKRPNNLVLPLDTAVSGEAVVECLGELRDNLASVLDSLELDVSNLKFASLLPAQMAQRMLKARAFGEEVYTAWRGMQVVLVQEGS